LRCIACAADGNTRRRPASDAPPPGNVNPVDRFQRARTLDLFMKGFRRGRR